MFASTYEGFGVPIIEAQAMGRVVITSNIEPMNKVAGNGAIIVDPYDVNSIKEAVLRIIDNVELRNDIILKGLKNASKYSSESIASKYLKLYKKVYS